MDWMFSMAGGCGLAALVAGWLVCIVGSWLDGAAGSCGLNFWQLVVGSWE